MEAAEVMLGHFLNILLVTQLSPAQGGEQTTQMPGREGHWLLTTVRYSLVPGEARNTKFHLKTVILICWQVVQFL